MPRHDFLGISFIITVSQISLLPSAYYLFLIRSGLPTTATRWRQADDIAAVYILIFIDYFLLMISVFRLLFMHTALRMQRAKYRMA